MILGSLIPHSPRRAKQERTLNLPSPALSVEVSLTRVLSLSFLLCCIDRNFAYCRASIYCEQLLHAGCSTVPELRAQVEVRVPSFQPLHSGGLYLTPPAPSLCCLWYQNGRISPKQLQGLGFSAADAAKLCQAASEPLSSLCKSM